MPLTVFNTLYSQLKDIHNRIAGLTKPFLPGERETLQHINVQHEALVGQVAACNELHPELNTPNVNWSRFEAAWQARAGYEALEKLTATLSKVCADAKIIADYSLVEMSMTAFDYIKEKGKETAAGSPYNQMIKQVEQHLPIGN